MMSCVSTNSRGEPCRAQVMVGSDTCIAHSSRHAEISHRGTVARKAKAAERRALEEATLREKLAEKAERQATAVVDRLFKIATEEPDSGKAHAAIRTIFEYRLTRAETAKPAPAAPYRISREEAELLARKVIRERDE